MSLESAEVYRLMDCIQTVSTVICDKCGRHNACGYDEMDAAEYFYSLGWRERKTKCLCPECSKPPNKQSK